jgi:hypothetical protein
MINQTYIIGNYIVKIVTYQIGLSKGFVLPKTKDITDMAIPVYITSYYTLSDECLDESITYIKRRYERIFLFAKPDTV